MSETTKDTKNKKINSKKTTTTIKAKTTPKITKTTKSKVTEKVTKTANPKAAKKTTKTTKPKATKKTTKKVTYPIVSEHYDLPTTYDKTFIVLLAQTPKTLFAFWEISDLDKSSLIEKYGSRFFENTRPVLVITNKTTNTTFEIEINDYATDWYIDVDKADCEFEIQLGRKPYNATNDFILIASSNILTSPNDHILLEKLPKTFKFLNLKTNKITEKSINTTSFSKIYNIYNFYKEMYKDELQDNPSSK